MFPLRYGLVFLRPQIPNIVSIQPDKVSHTAGFRRLFFHFLFVMFVFVLLSNSFLLLLIFACVSRYTQAGCEHDPSCLSCVVSLHGAEWGETECALNGISIPVSQKKKPFHLILQFYNTTIWSTAHTNLSKNDWLITSSHRKHLVAICLKSK